MVMQEPPPLKSSTLELYNYSKNFISTERILTQVVGEGGGGLF